MSKKSASAAVEVRTLDTEKAVPHTTPHRVRSCCQTTAGTSGTHTDKGHLANRHGEG